MTTYSNKFWNDLINWFNMIDIKIEALSEIDNMEKKNGKLEKASRFSSTQSFLDPGKTSYLLLPK